MATLFAVSFRVAVLHSWFFLGLVLCLWNHWKNVSYIKNHNKINFSGRGSCLLYILYVLCLIYCTEKKICSAKMHKVWAETRPESLTPCGQGIHGIILSWKAHLQVKMLDAHQVRQRWWVFIDKIPFCNLLVSINQQQ